MRIGLEMFGTQSDSRHRGIGRYCRNLASALVAESADAGHHWITYYAKEGAAEAVMDIPGAESRTLAPRPTLGSAVTRLMQTNPDQLDWLLILNPLEVTPGFDVPDKPTHGGPALGAVVYDLIPWILQDRYLRRWPGSEFARRYTLALERLRRYDVLLAISDATRDDVVRLLNVDPARVVAIGTAADDRAANFSPDRDDPADLATVRGLGLTRRFVSTVIAYDSRKNLDGLIRAFARLPAALAEAHQLAVIAPIDVHAVGRARVLARELGLADDALVITGPVSDLALRAVYRRCEAFVFPSLYEGFGLPIVEAMACGAAVVAGTNSSQPEAAGDAGVLVDVADPGAIASAMTRVLTDAALASDLRQRAPIQARRFSWRNVARRTLRALDSGRPSDGTRIDPREPRIPRGRVAVFASLPPDVAEDFSASLGTLLGSARLDLFHEPNARPFARFQFRGVGCFDRRLFRRFDRIRPYEMLIVDSPESAERLREEEPSLAGRTLRTFADLSGACEDLPSPSGFLRGPHLFKTEYRRERGVG